MRAVRYEKYDPGDSTWVPKVGLRVASHQGHRVARNVLQELHRSEPVPDQRPDERRGFHASSTWVRDPNRRRRRAVLIPSLGNIRADTYTAGIVISPHQVPGLTLNGDFFHVEERDLIGAIPDVDHHHQRQRTGSGVAVRRVRSPWQLHGSERHRAWPTRRQPAAVLRR